MIAGHTTFDPDWHFGVWKLRWRSSTVETLDEVAQTVTNSSRNRHNIPQLKKDQDKLRDWKSYLKQKFKPLKNLTKYHHFLLDTTKSGTVLCKELNDSPTVSVNLLKRKDFLPSDEPEDMVSAGLDPLRQWYLYDSIREFCKTQSSQNITCPKPTVPKSEVDLVKEIDKVPSLPSKRKGLLLR